MENLTNSQYSYISELSGPGYLVFSVVFLLLVLLPTVVVNVFIVVLLALDKTTAKHMRLVLGNIPVACIIVALGLSIYHLTGIHLNISDNSPPDDNLCRFITMVLAFGGIARLLFMTAFSGIVFVVVRCQNLKTTRQFVTICVTVAGLWFLAFLGTAPLFSDQVVHTFFSDNVSCGPVPVGIFSYVYVCLYLVLFGVCTFGVTIALLTLTVCYIRRRSIADSEMKKAMLKLGFFLLIGNIVNIIGQILPALIATFLVSFENAEAKNYGIGDVALIYFSYIMLNISLIPPPILIMVYFKPIVGLLRRWFSCHKSDSGRRRKSSQVISSHLINDDIVVTTKL